MSHINREKELRCWNNLDWWKLLYAVLAVSVRSAERCNLKELHKSISVERERSNTHFNL